VNCGFIGEYPVEPIQERESTLYYYGGLLTSVLEWSYDNRNVEKARFTSETQSSDFFAEYNIKDGGVPLLDVAQDVLNGTMSADPTFPTRYGMVTMLKYHNVTSKDTLQCRVYERKNNLFSTASWETVTTIQLVDRYRICAEPINVTDFYCHRRSEFSNILTSWNCTAIVHTRRPVESRTVAYTQPYFLINNEYKKLEWQTVETSDTESVYNTYIYNDLLESSLTEVTLATRCPTTNNTINENATMTDTYGIERPTNSSELTTVPTIQPTDAIVTTDSSELTTVPAVQPINVIVPTDSSELTTSELTTVPAVQPINVIIPTDSSELTTSELTTLPAVQPINVIIPTDSSELTTVPAVQPINAIVPTTNPTTSSPTTRKPPKLESNHMTAFQVITTVAIASVAAVAIVAPIIIMYIVRVVL